MPGKYNLSAHKTARRARRVIALYGTDYQWITRLIHAELKIQRKIKEQSEPNTTKYAAATTTILQCESVLQRLSMGTIQWEPGTK